MKGSKESAQKGKDSHKTGSGLSAGKWEVKGDRRAMGGS